jgi:hypothetical protein
MSIDKKWNSTPLEKSPKIVHPPKTQSQSGPEPGRKNPVGLRKNWVNKTSLGFRNPAFNPMVSNFETRRGNNQMENDQRLQRIKSAVSSETFQAGSHPAHFPCVGKRPLGSKNRPKGCLLPHTSEPGPKAISKTSGGGADLGIPGRLFWPECNAPNFYVSNEDIRKAVEKKGHPGIYLPGRHFTGGPNTKHLTKSPEHSGQGFNQIRTQNQCEKVHPGAHPNRKSSWISTKLPRGKIKGAPSENKNSKKGAGKNGEKRLHVKKATGCHFGPNQMQSNGPALSKGLYGCPGNFFGGKFHSPLGLKTSRFPKNK